MADAAGGLNETAAAVREGLATAVSAYSVTAAETVDFLTAHGPAVIHHAPVGEPGRQSDPDLERYASDG